jgi:hypothetical protein
MANVERQITDKSPFQRAGGPLGYAHLKLRDLHCLTVSSARCPTTRERATTARNLCFVITSPSPISEPRVAPRGAPYSSSPDTADRCDAATYRVLDLVLRGDVVEGVVVCASADAEEMSPRNRGMKHVCHPFLGDTASELARGLPREDERL